MKKYENRVILVISDTHAPYSHPDTIDYLAAINKEYKPDRVIHMGDETDQHAISFHPTDPDLYSAGHELDAAVVELKKMYKIFPRVDLLESNHGKRASRKAKTYGLPKRVLKAYRDAIEAPEGWKWHKQLIITMSDGYSVAFRHEFQGDTLKAAEKMGCSVVEGHKHTKCEIRHLITPTKELWAMTVGCCIDTTSSAFDYDAANLSRPIINHSLIVDGQPRLLLMPMNAAGRWTGKVP